MALHCCNQISVKKNFIIEFITSPGRIYSEFILPLKNNGIKINKHYYLSFSPRRDWTFDNIEEHTKRPLWASNGMAKKISLTLFSFLHKDIVIIKEIVKHMVMKVFVN